MLEHEGASGVSVYTVTVGAGHTVGQQWQEQQAPLSETDTVEKAMLRFRRKGRVYKVITMETPLEELEEFFKGGKSGMVEPQDFAVVTDPERRFVLGVVTKADLEEFVRRRPLLT